MDPGQAARLVAAIRSQYQLDGEELIGRRAYFNKAQGRYVVMVDFEGRPRTLSVARVKFALHHGWLPPMVDHKDRDPSNDLLDNLRAATRQQNGRNREVPPRDLPRGVYRQGRGFKACVTHGKVFTYLGFFRTADEALTAVTAFKEKHHGEFYAQSS